MNKQRHKRTSQLRCCKECDAYGRWHVWYKGFSSPTVLPFPPANIAYNTLCDEHTVEHLLHGYNGWQVACVKLVADQFLPDDDRAKQSEQETP